MTSRHSDEERLVLEVETVTADSERQRRDALNEAVVEKTSSGHTVSVAVDIDDEFFTSYVADGLIIATPTGSTAYNFSVRGPILSPAVQALVLTPVAPHMLFDFSLVLPASGTVKVTVR